MHYEQYMWISILFLVLMLSSGGATVMSACLRDIGSVALCRLRHPHLPSRPTIVLVTGGDQIITVGSGKGEHPNRAGGDSEGSTLRKSRVQGK
jgi:hypothetical protein